MSDVDRVPSVEAVVFVLLFQRSQALWKLEQGRSHHLTFKLREGFGFFCYSLFPSLNSFKWNWKVWNEREYDFSDLGYATWPLGSRPNLEHGFQNCCKY